MKENEKIYDAVKSVAVLLELRDGECVNEFLEKIEKCTAACLMTGKKGEVTLKLTLTPQGTQIIVKDDFKEKIPEFSVQPTVMFATPEGKMSRRSPRQMTLSDAAVKVQEKEESVRVDPETGEVIKVQ